MWAAGFSGWTRGSDPGVSSIGTETGWTIVSSPNPHPIRNYLAGLAATGPADLWAVGYVTDYGANTYQTLIEHWDGTSWTLAASPRPGRSSTLEGIGAVGPGDVWAVGVQDSNITYQTLIAHYSDSCAGPSPTPTPPRSPTPSPTP